MNPEKKYYYSHERSESNLRSSHTQVQFIFATHSNDVFRFFFIQTLHENLQRDLVFYVFSNKQNIRGKINSHKERKAIFSKVISYSKMLSGLTCHDIKPLPSIYKKQPDLWPLLPPVTMYTPEKENVYLRETRKKKLFREYTRNLYYIHGAPLKKISVKKKAG